MIDPRAATRLVGREATSSPIVVADLDIVVRGFTEMLRSIAMCARANSLLMVKSVSKLGLNR